MPRDYWGFGNPDLSKFGKPRKEDSKLLNTTQIELPKKDIGTPPKFPTLKQKVCRTSSPGSPNKLQELLDDGWKVIFATQLSDGIIEYILEKYV